MPKGSQTEEKILATDKTEETKKTEKTDEKATKEPQKPVRKKLLTNEQLSMFFHEVSLLLHTGLTARDSVMLLSENTGSDFLKELSQEMALGRTLPEVMRASSRFPDYAVGLAEAGERFYRLEETFQLLSSHYDDCERFDRRLRSVLLYPVITLTLMLVVITALLCKVLPAFQEAYASLGERLNFLYGGMLTLGHWLNDNLTSLLLILAVVALLVILFAVNRPFRLLLLRLWRRLRGDKGVSRQRNDACLAQAMAMGMRSGLSLADSLSLAGGLQCDIPAAQKRYQSCLEQLQNGKEPAQALQETGVLPASCCRLLALGIRDGAASLAMEEIARRLTEDSELAFEECFSHVEPTLVLVTSLIVGLLLLSFMLPLMNIMSAIG